ncbi:MAG: hypothetical protein JKY22_06920 [Flavobacteriaceae bacterium]|nr:hypothetical protein [Flavobacteriaceae bacterium]
MKYTRLTKEQLEELHKEFINFLATQSITAAEWKQIKEQEPEAAEQELDVFSDLIWEGVLNNAKYLQNSSTQQLFLFQLDEAVMNLIVVKVLDTSVNLTTTEGITWLNHHFQSNNVELYTATKTYSEDKNKDVFELIRQGAEIVNGNLFNDLSKILNSGE